MKLVLCTGTTGSDRRGYTDEVRDLCQGQIQQSDLVVVYYPKVAHTEAETGGGFYIPLSAGVICEMVHGHRKGKRVYQVWLPESDPSPFFTFHCKEWFRGTAERVGHLREHEVLEASGS